MSRPRSLLLQSSGDKMEDKEDKPPVLPKRAKPILPERDQGSNWASNSSSEPGAKSHFDKVRQNITKINNLYTYPPVDLLTTRLLTIQPRSTYQRDIYATLTQVPYHELGDRAQYEALSYNWGKDDATEIIHIRNDPSTKTGIAQLPNLDKDNAIKEAVKYFSYREFRVTPNLFQALQHLRDDNDPIRLWVDALCIDQSNLEEKKIQVAHMNKIYSKAEIVLIWLGKGNEQTKSTFNFIEKIMRLDRLNTLVSSSPAMSNVNDWRDFLALMQRPWFSRRWVIQELALARDAVVYCGENHTHWNNLRDAVSMFALKLDPIRELFKRSGDFDNNYHAIGEFEALGARVLVETINNIFRKAEAGRAPEPVLGLEYLVSTLSNFDTSDPRDTIHALRNIAKESGRGKHRSRRGGATMRRLEPDYNKDLLQVYIEFVRWVEESTGSIDIICRHWALPEREKKVDHYPALVELPSWIQVFSNLTGGRQGDAAHRIDGDSFVGLPDQRAYDASHGINASVHYRIDETQRVEDTGKKRSKSKKHAHRPSKDSQVKAGAELDDATHPAEVTLGHTDPPLDTAREDDIDAGSRTDSAYGSSSPKSGLLADHEMNGSGVKTPSIQMPANETKSAPPRSLSKDRESLRKEREMLRKTICVDGLEIGKLNWVTDPIPDGVIPLRVLQTLGLNQRGLEPLNKAWQNLAANPPDKLWRTIVAERGADGRNPPAWYYRACQHCLVNDSPNGHINTRELLRKVQPDWVRDFLKRVQAVTWNRVFLEATPVGQVSTRPDYSECETSSSSDDESQAGLGAAQEDDNNAELGVRSASDVKDGAERMNRDKPGPSTLPEIERTKSNVAEKLHGLGPSNAREGDSVCILFGCSVPCILRPQTDEFGDYYTFVGEAYIYGLMDGEAVMWKKKKEIQKAKTRFNIR